MDPQKLLGVWVGLEQETAGGNPFSETGRKVTKVMNEDGFGGAGRDDRRIQKTTDCS